MSIVIGNIIQRGICMKAYILDKCFKFFRNWEEKGPVALIDKKIDNVHIFQNLKENATDLEMRCI
jgi:hypothetical protein